MPATYKSLQCYRCGGRIEQCTLTDTWKLRLDGALHDVPVQNVPCHRCMSCGNTTLDGASDEVVMWCTHAYMTKNGMNTPYRRVRRWLRHRMEAWQTRIWLARRNFASKLGRASR